MSLALKTKDIISHFDFKFNKNLGQNFLIDEDILKKTVDSMELTEDSCVIEIGPGIGTLTQEMAKRCSRVVAVELDDSLIPILQETLGNYTNVKVIRDDALKVDFKRMIEEEGLKDVTLAANLPYYVTTPVMTKVFSEKPGIKSFVVMVQKEAADRIMAKPGSKEYGIVSTLVQYNARVSKVCRVPQSSFIPQPRVESMVIKIDMRDEPAVKVMDEKLFFSIIKNSFNMRRKTMLNVLKQTGLSEDALKSAFKAAGIDPQRRGETLALEEFAVLSDEVKRRQ